MMLDGKIVEIGIGVKLAEQGQSRVMTATETGHFMRSIPGIPYKNKGSFGKPHQEESKQSAHQLSGSVVSSTFEVVEFRSTVEINEQR